MDLQLSSSNLIKQSYLKGATSSHVMFFIRPEKTILSCVITCACQCLFRSCLFRNIFFVARDNCIINDTVYRLINSECLYYKIDKIVSDIFITGENSGLLWNDVWIIQLILLRNTSSTGTLLWRLNFDMFWRTEIYHVIYHPFGWFRIVGFNFSTFLCLRKQFFFVAVFVVVIVDINYWRRYPRWLMTTSWIMLQNIVITYTRQPGLDLCR